MRRVLSFLLLAAIGVLLLVFLVANRQPVILSMDPFAPDDPAFGIGPVPLSAVLAIPLFVGYGLGAFGMWLSGAKRRRHAREQRRALRRLEEEVKALRSQTQTDREVVAIDTYAAAPGATPTSLPAARA
jgi:hypothetical protein